ncbi:hypothetical protein MKHDV_02875 [Halodesulfovibrio sp. MK-HDV]|nr:hypothetical protein MKHDV_02875 [Halodesulfovibrio sp. MK-HDV]
MLLRIRTTDGLTFSTRIFTSKKSAFVSEDALSDSNLKSLTGLTVWETYLRRAHFIKNGIRRNWSKKGKCMSKKGTCIENCARRNHSKTHQIKGQAYPTTYSFEAMEHILR